MAKTDFLTADMTRRQFMKISGKSLAGLTLSASMLSLFGCSQKQVDSGAVATWALPQGLLVVNADLCTGCQRCEINCTLTNDGVCSSYISRVKIQRRLNLDGAGNGLLSGNDNCFVYFPDTCRQCEDPACGNACPQKAITTNEQGIRVVDTDKCIGCGACVRACEHGATRVLSLNEGTGKIEKDPCCCVGCGECVKACPTSAWTRQETKFYRVILGGRTGRQTPRTGKMFLNWATEDVVLGVLKNWQKFSAWVMDYKPEYLHGGHLIDRAGYKKFKEIILDGVELNPECLVAEDIFWHETEYRSNFNVKPVAMHHKAGPQA